MVIWKEFLKFNLLENKNKEKRELTEILYRNAKCVRGLKFRYFNFYPKADDNFAS